MDVRQCVEAEKKKNCDSLSYESLMPIKENTDRKRKKRRKEEKTWIELKPN